MSNAQGLPRGDLSTKRRKTSRRKQQQRDRAEKLRRLEEKRADLEDGQSKEEIHAKGKASHITPLPGSNKDSLHFGEENQQKYSAGAYSRKLLREKGGQKTQALHPAEIQERIKQIKRQPTEQDFQLMHREQGAHL